MIPKRILLFLSVVVLTLLVTIGYPYLEKADKISSSINTSPSSSPYGYKALYFLVKELAGQPTEFWHHSIMNLPLDKPQTLWLTEPAEGLFFDGDVYADRMRTLVENGYHMIFVLNSQSMEFKDREDKSVKVLDYLNKWYGLSIKTIDLEEISNTKIFTVKSNFLTRKIHKLEFEQPVQYVKTKSILSKYKKKHLNSAKFDSNQQEKSINLIAFDSSTIKPATSLLTVGDNIPLAIMTRQGRGAITIFLNGFFLSNGQLDKSDNAALAMAFQEQFPNYPTLFETHSSGFTDNKDIITYLATGQGITLLITSTLMLIAFAFWLANQPTRKIYSLKSSDERYFTQEVFIQALAKHYISTHRWIDLYKKMLQNFQTGLEQRWPYYAQEERLKAIAQNHFIGLSLEELESVFVLKNISSEETFVKKCQELFNVQRKVFNNEQYK